MVATSKNSIKKRKTQQKKSQGDLVFALDIGTRSIIGIVGRVVGDLFEVLAIESEEHTRRSMKDGQIENIDQVAQVARRVKQRLENSLKISLRKVCIAAAGRALRTKKASYEIDLEQPQLIDDQLISRLEIGAVTAAEESFNKESNAENGEQDKGFFLVGYSVLSYYLDNFNISSLKDHKGKNLRADVIATFLPSEVVDSLYMTMQKCNLEVVSLTLEPIAAINAAIPQDLRLLNLALVDIGAGTSDIAVCRDGGITGYTMATVAGDEVSEALMKHFLVDFNTAEYIKMHYSDQESISFTNILGIEEAVQRDEIVEILNNPIQNLSEEIVSRVKEINNGVPSAVFLAGGGSKLAGLKETISKEFDMDNRRVAIAGGNFKISAFSSKYDLDNPEYATPLGIAVSSGLRLLHDSLQILLNGKPAKVFKSGDLRIIDVLMMNGYGYVHILGRSGKNILVNVEGQKKVFYGERAVPAVLKLNEKVASISDMVQAGDRVDFTPALSGKDAEPVAGDLLNDGFSEADWDIYINEKKVELSTLLKSGDEIYFKKRISQEDTGDALPPVDTPDHAVLQEYTESSLPSDISPPEKTGNEYHVTLNGTSLELEPKEDNEPYYLMDLLEFSGLDFNNLNSSVLLRVNGDDSNFTREIKNNDIIEIKCDEIIAD